jgi:hypothetical protein
MGGTTTDLGVLQRRPPAGHRAGRRGGRLAHHGARDRRAHHRAGRRQRDPPGRRRQADASVRSGWCRWRCWVRATRRCWPAGGRPGRCRRRILAARPLCAAALRRARRRGIGRAQPARTRGAGAGHRTSRSPCASWPSRSVRSAPWPRSSARAWCRSAGFTPSDAAHVLGLQHNWSTPAAQMAAQLACRLRDMKFPTPERTAAVRARCLERDGAPERPPFWTPRSASTCAKTSWSTPSVPATGRWAWPGSASRPSMPVVAVGGPVRVYYRRGRPPPGLPGRVPGTLRGGQRRRCGHRRGGADRVTVRVVGDGSGLFVLHSPVGTRQFTDPQAGTAGGDRTGAAAAIDAVVAMGAVADPEVRVTVSKQLLPNAGERHRIAGGRGHWPRRSGGRTRRQTPDRSAGILYTITQTHFRSPA